MIKPILTLLLAIYLVINVIGCGDDDPDSKPTEIGGTGVVSGKISDGVTSALLSGVNVNIGSNQTLSDANGFYSVEGIAAGNFTITASLSGYKVHAGSVTVGENSTTSHDIVLNQKVNATLLDDFDFESGAVGPFTGDWVLDDTAASNVMRPPETLAGVTTSIEIKYTQNHTVMSFSRKVSFDNITLDLYIDEKYYDSYGAANGWKRFTVLVPEGAHTYRWVVTTNTTEQPEVFLDDISFSHTPPQADSTGPYGFEEGFMTQEFTTWNNTGDWIIDDTPNNNGNFTLHPPHVLSGVKSSTQLDYSQVHTKIEFSLFIRFDKIKVDLYIDGKYYDTYPSGRTWRQIKVLVPQGKHIYRWDVTPTNDGLPPVYIDNITFTNTTPTSNPTGPYGFEEGFITREFSTWADANKTNGWIIDNSGPFDGEYSIRPPSVAADTTTSTEITYSLPHSQITFSLFVRFDQITVQLFIDNVPHKTYLQGGVTVYTESLGFTDGARTYRWEVTSNMAGHPPVTLDSISFQ